MDDLSDYFSKQGVDIPRDVNPAERMIDIVSGDLSKGRDWNKVWLDSEECEARSHELEQLKESSHGAQAAADDDQYEYASTTLMQLKLVTKRASIQVSVPWFLTGDLHRSTTIALEGYRIHHEQGSAPCLLGFVQRF